MLFTFLFGFNRSVPYVEKHRENSPYSFFLKRGQATKMDFVNMVIDFDRRLKRIEKALHIDTSKDVYP